MNDYDSRIERLELRDNDRGCFSVVLFVFAFLFFLPVIIHAASLSIEYWSAQPSIQEVIRILWLSETP